MNNFFFPILFKIFRQRPFAGTSTIIPATLTPELNQNLNVLVTVRNRKGNPLEGVPVEIVVSSGVVDIDVAPLSGVTDSDGEITFVLLGDTEVEAQVGVLVNEGPSEFTLSATVEFVQP